MVCWWGKHTWQITHSNDTYPKWCVKCGKRSKGIKTYRRKNKRIGITIGVISAVIVCFFLIYSDVAQTYIIIPSQNFLHILLPQLQLPQISLPNFIATKPSQTPSETPQGQTNPPTSTGNSQVVFSNCLMVSNGAGGIRVNCANHDSIQCISNPPIGSGIQKDVTLTIDENSCIVQYQNSTESNTVYHFQLGTSPSVTSPNPSNNPPTSSSPPSILPKVTFPKITLPKVTIPAITIPGSSNVQSPTQPTDLPSLYAYALKIVNDDRKANGLNPVALSSIPSAQNHADDQLNLKYFSHWNSEAVKPYVVYTKLGGRGSVAENNYYTYSYCPASNCIENTYDPYVEIKKGEDEMMNNDASSNWGHKNNILDPHHSHVNFGIAYDHDRFYFVENFENDLVNWQTVELAGSKLTMVGTIQQGYSMDHVDVFSDPKPKTLTEPELDNQAPYNAGYYDQGNNVGIIMPKLTGNYYYPECSPGKTTVTSSDGSTECLDYATYDNNPTNPNTINVAVDVSKWTNSDGLHTIYVNFKDSNGNLVQATSLTLEYLK